MKNKLVNRLGRIALWGLATYGLVSLLSKVDITPDYLKEKKGQLSGGMQYNSRLTRLNHPYDILANKYVINFGDSIKVEDAFVDGYIDPLEIEDKNGNRIISSQQLEGHEKDYSAVLVDDDKRREILQRIAEVYQQQGINVEVREH